MNQGKAAELRKESNFKPNSERKYHTDDQRKLYQKLKKEHTRRS